MPCVRSSTGLIGTGSSQMLLVIVCIVIAVALIFDFTNGFHDSANAMATSVATGAFRPRQAVLIAAILNVIGACLSTEVAHTISSGMVDENLITPEVVFAGLAGAIVWNLLTWLFGMPSSSSHAMFGALIGAVLATVGFHGVHGGVIVSKILLPALVAPLVAGLASALSTVFTYRITDHDNTHAQMIFRQGQRLSASMVALAHGTSDGQKTMGIITLVLVSAGYQTPGSRPHWWVIGAAGLAIGLGTYSGGWRIMRTMGKGLVEIEPPQGFVAETSSTVAILASAHLGFGLSTTHVCSGSILGSGVGRGTKVNWRIAGRMFIAWILTLPAAGIVGALCGMIANSGLIGFGVVVAFLIIVSVVIFMISLRNKVDGNNVSETGEVRLHVVKAPNMAKYNPAAKPSSSAPMGVSA